MNTPTPPPLKACLICYPFFPTRDSGRGVDRYSIELAENLERAGTSVVLPALEGGSSEGVLAAGGKLARVFGELPGVAADVFHALSTPAGAAAVALRKRPLVVSIHDLLPFQVRGYNSRLKSSYARFCTTLSVRHADALIVPFQVTKDELVADHGARADDVHVVHFGLDHATYFPRPHLARSPREVLYLGEVSRAKGVDVLLRAFVAVERKLGDAKLLICGKPNQDRPGLLRLAEELGLRNVEFRGFVPEAELPEYYARATVMTFPSRNGFGLSSLEAMACGAPVVVAATLDAPEFIGDGGLMARPGDADDLARCLLELLENAAQREALSAKGIERAREFSWRKMAEDTRAVYERVRRAPRV
jgi:glycosyltransferase involved in cell wall biosynthesis